MIVIAASLPINPENRDAAIEASVKMARATREEPGCIEYAFHQDLEDPNRFHVFEKWESGEALEAHFKTPHMAAFQAVAGDFIKGPADAKRYEIASEGPVFPE